MRSSFSMRSSSTTCPMYYLLSYTPMYSITSGRDGDEPGPLVAYTRTPSTASGSSRRENDHEKSLTNDISKGLGVTSMGDGCLTDVGDP